LVLAGAIALCPRAQAGFDLVKGWLEKVSDGDTVWVQENTRRLPSLPEMIGGGILRDGPETRIKVRMLGIDAAETQLPTPSHGVVSQGHWGTRATEYLAKLAPVGSDVALEDYGTDYYKRTLGRLLRDDRDIDMAMVESGWAVTYIICSGPDCSPGFFAEHHVKEYVAACERARSSGLGVWNPSDPLPEMPFEFRLRMQERDPEKWVGNFRTKLLYSPEDYSQIPHCQRIFFMTHGEGIRAGYRDRG